MARIQAPEPGNWRDVLWLLAAETAALLLIGAALGIGPAFLGHKPAFSSRTPAA
jgi:hypothetical protein